MLHKLKIWARLVIVIWLLITIAGAGVLAWAVHVQRNTAIEQARDFVQSVHQMTLAGLTAMMITGDVADRAVFLDQIKQSNNIRALRVVRGEAVDRQYGRGSAAELPSGAFEREVLASGKPHYRVRREGGSEVISAILPVTAHRNYLGKDCLGCHQVAEGTVLGAVAMEVSLDKVNAAVDDFLIRIVATGLLVSMPLIFLIYLSLARSVTRPLQSMTRGLNRIAGGEIDPASRLPVRGNDEIAEAARAFNRVMGKAHQMVEAEQVSADVFEHALEGIMVADRTGRILKVNPAFTHTTGYLPHEAVGQTPRMLQSGRHDRAFYESFWRALTTRGQWQGDIWNRRKNGEIYPQWLNVSSVRDERGEVKYYIAVFSDITERKRQEALITYQAYHDSLTGLPNRILFKDRLEQALAVARRQGDGLVAVMFLDLDRFKFINDSLGHDMGDELLKEVARRLRGAVREVDTVARLGGDEFTVMLPDIAHAKNAEVVAAKILAATKQPYRLAERDLFVTASIGISLYPADAQDAESLMKQADTAMYSVKGHGRAGFRFYTPDLSERSMQHLLLESELNRALERDEFRVFYQPQFAFDSSEVVGVEALMRWDHPYRGLLQPSDFLHLAEETGLIVPIGERLLRVACGQAAAWRRNGHRRLMLSVNLTPRQFYSATLADSVSHALEVSGLPADRLELEITESLAMQDPDVSAAVIRALASIGVSVAICEFGAGFRSAVNALQRMAVNSIKIDRSFVRDLAGDAKTARLLAGIVSAARDPKLRVMAIGVENRQQLEQLRALRCDAVQGDLLGKPAPAEEIGALLAEALSVAG